MTADEVAALFTRGDGSYLFARWARLLAPVVFGVEDSTLAMVKKAIESVASIARHPLAETDPEQGANLMIFFFRDWAELLTVPDIEGLVPGLSGRIAQFQAEGADQYRHFRFEPDGAIRACIAFVRMDGALADVPAADLALSLAVQVMLLWSDGAFRNRPALMRTETGAVLRPDIAAVLRAAYDPALPPVAHDRSHALRLAARLPAIIS